MNTIFERLDKFYHGEDHVLLLEGEWGVGKTFIINKWIEKLPKNKNIRIISLSLFGMASENDLNTQLLEKAFVLNKINKKIGKVCSQVGASYQKVPVTFSMALSGLFSIFAKQEYKQNSKKKNIIILDDIERKDNRLSLNQVFGFVDSLKLENTKVILVSNCNILKNSDSFKLKEKIIDEEIKIKAPTKEAVESIVPIEIINCIDFSYCTNLRTIKKFVKLYTMYKKDEDVCLFNIIFASIAKLDNEIFTRNELIQRKSSQELQSAKILESVLNEKNDENKIKTEIEKKYSKESIDESEVLFEHLKDYEIYSNISEKDLRNGVGFIFNCIESGQYEKAFEYKFRYIETNRSKLKINADSLFYTDKPYEKIYEMLVEINAACESNNYDYFNIYEQFRLISQYHNEGIYFCKRNELFLNKVSKVLAKRLAEEIMEIIPNVNKVLSHNSNYVKENDYCKSLDKQILKEIEKMYSNKITSLISKNELVCFVPSEIRKINEIIKETGLSFDVNLKKELYKKAINISIRALKDDISNSWENIHLLFKNISDDKDIENKDMLLFLDNKSKNLSKLQKYRLGFLRGYFTK